MVKIELSHEALTEMAGKGDVEALGQVIDSPSYSLESRSSCIIYLPTAVKAAIELGREDVYPRIGGLRSCASLSEGMVAMLFNYAASFEAKHKGAYAPDEADSALLFAYMFDTMMDEKERFEANQRAASGPDVKEAQRKSEGPSLKQRSSDRIERSEDLLRRLRRKAKGDAYWKGFAQKKSPSKK